MKPEIKWTIYLVGLGMSLVAYAHMTFSTKTEVKEVRELVVSNDKKTNKAISRIDERVYDIWKEVVK